MRSSHFATALIALAFALAPVFVAAAAARSTPRVSDDDTATDEATLAIHALDDSGGDAFGVDVTIMPADDATARRFGERLRNVGRTDPDGLVWLDVPAHGTYVVNARLGRVGRAEPVVVEALAPGSALEVELRVQIAPDLEITGRVVDAETGAPIAAARVRTKSWTSYPTVVRAAPFVDDGAPVEHTDDDGCVAIDVRSWNWSYVAIEARGYAPTCAVVHDPSASRAAATEWRLRPAAALTGSVRTDTVRSNAVRVVADRAHLFGGRSAELRGTGGDVAWWGELAADGTFAVEGLPVDVPLALEFFANRDLVHRERFRAGFVSGEHDVGVIEPAASYGVTGVVVDGLGAPVAEQVVRLVAEREFGGAAMIGGTTIDPPAAASTHTDAHGRFDLPSVERGRYHVVLPRAPRDLPLERSYAAAARPVDLRGSDADVVLVRHVGVFVDGTLYRPDGEPCREAAYVDAAVEGAEAPFVALDSARVDARGRFRIGPLVAGRRYTLSCTPFGLGSGFANVSRAVRTDVLAGERGIELKLPPATVVSGTVRDAQGAPVPARIEARRPLGHWPNGFHTPPGQAAFEIPHLAPGPVTVIARTDDDRIGVLELEVRAGEPRRDVDLVLATGARLRATLGGSARYARIVVRRGAAVLHDGSIAVNRPLDVLVPAGALTVELHPGGGPHTPIVDERRVELEAGAAVDLAFELDAQPDPTDEER